jgi:hypothetical protein
LGFADFGVDLFAALVEFGDRQWGARWLARG